MMEVDFSEWMTLKDAHLRAMASLGSPEAADRAMRYHLDRSDIRAICEEIRAFPLETHEYEADEFWVRWSRVAPAFWPGSEIDWENNSAELDAKNARPHEKIEPGCGYSATGLMLCRADVFGLWPGGASASSATAERPRRVAAAAQVKAVLKEVATKDLTDLELRQKVCQRLNVDDISRAVWREAKRDLKKDPDVAARFRTKGDTSRSITRR
jgi:hypothetical protein